MIENIVEVFEKFDDEFLEFYRVENKLSSRKDLHAFILLNSLISSNEDIVGAADHEEIYLNIDVEELCKVISEAQVCDLIRCGIRYSEEYESLCMFV